MPKSESVCEYSWKSTRHVEAVAACSVSDLEWERTRSQDGLRETIGLQSSASTRAWRVPVQLSWPLIDGCRKQCCREGEVEAERRESRQVGQGLCVVP